MVNGFKVITLCGSTRLKATSLFLWGCLATLVMMWFGQKV